MKLIFGLGNPGRKYSGTRHNIGFMVLEKLAARYGASFSSRLFKSLIAEASIKIQSDEGLKSEKVILIEPQTFMNLSGEAVSTIYRWYKIELKDILVVCDDFSLPFGTARFREKGRDGGHNGLKSIINLTGSVDFPRLRLGIGKPTMEDPADFVLGDFSADEQKKLNDELLDIYADGVDFYIKNGIIKSMSVYNKNFIP